MLRGLILITIALNSFTGRAAHLVGGEIYYSCLGNNSYEITLVIYRDCFSSGAPFDATVPITIFDGNNDVVSNLHVPIHWFFRLPITAPNSCSSISDVACTERGSYTYVQNLPPSPGGYTIAHQRCCRNNTIGNIPKPGDWGNTYTVSIPPNDTSCNSSPIFDSVPPVALCHNQKFRLDMSATDADGDSLSYELCELLHGGESSVPAPSVASPPPYTVIPFRPGYSYDNPITSNPTISIDPRTGLISGRPTNVGQYVFAVCVKEFRNGVFLSTVRRDFQFNVTSSCTGVISLAETQVSNPSTLCIGRTIQFRNLSINASSYLWDFGDPSTDSDTSSLTHPTYTYSDTGTFRVRLIADPGGACADTNSWLFKVYDAVEFTYSKSGDSCFDTHSLDFDVSNTYSPSARYEWDFDTQTNLGRTSNLRAPKGVVFPQAGSYPVSLKITDKGCEGSFLDTVRLYVRPKLLHSAPSGKFCMPVSLKFTDSSSSSGTVQHYWDFGDGFTSNQEDPVHKYLQEGIYWVEHSILTRDGCQDSLHERFPDPIEIFSKPSAHISVDPTLVPIYMPLVKIESSDQRAARSTTFISDGQVISDLKEEYIQFKETGTFIIMHVAESESGCSDTSYAQVTVEAFSDVYVPNAFTPNNDGVNDYFDMKVSGVESYYISIFSRWGKMVFESDDLQKSWNGKLMNTGEAAPEGVYTYRLLLKFVGKPNDDVLKYGTIQLIR